MEMGKGLIPMKIKEPCNYYNLDNNLCTGKLETLIKTLRTTHTKIDIPYDMLFSPESIKSNNADVTNILSLEIERDVSEDEVEKEGILKKLNI